MREEDLIYPSEKVADAVKALAGVGSIHSRVSSAYSPFRRLSLNDFKNEVLRSQFKEIKQRLNGGEQGVISATINQMSEQEAGEIANMIVDLYVDITRHRLHATRDRETKPFAK